MCDHLVVATKIRVQVSTRSLGYTNTPFAQMVILFVQKGQVLCRKTSQNNTSDRKFMHLHEVVPTPSAKPITQL